MLSEVYVTTAKEMQPLVLILVLMEYALWVFNQDFDNAGFDIVLILVLMEYALWDENNRIN